MSTPPLYSERFDQALALVADAFRHEARKSTTIPYVTHLLQVAVTVAEHGGDEEQVIAALLHDYLEDIEGATFEAVRYQFGTRVAETVLALSDTTERLKPPWQARKDAYLAKLRDEPPHVKLVSAADKLHNARCIVRDARVVGDALWARFNTGGDQKERTLWYYREVVVALETGWDHPLLNELRSVVAEMQGA